MEGEFREMQLKDVGEIRVEEAASRVIGKVMYCRVEVGSLLVYLLFRKQRGDRRSEQGLRVHH